MKKNRTYEIKNMDDFCISIRNAVFLDMNKNPEKSENIDEFITLGQVKNIVFNNCMLCEETDKVMINEEIYGKIFDEVSSDMYGSALSKLASAGYLESAWDDKIGDMVFWFKEE
jgi:hypothetical protein